MASGVVFENETGEILLVKPTYKDYWSVPGGVIEKDESPMAAALRETKEEIGLDAGHVRLLGIDYMSPQDSGYSNKEENIQFIFYGGILTAEHIKKIKVSENEISEYRFVDKDEALGLVNDRLAHRLVPCFEAIRTGKPCYLEGGKRE